MLKARVTFLGLCLIVLFSISPVTPVFAAVSMSVAQGIVASTVTVSELTAGQNYVILWDGTSLASGVVPTNNTVSFAVPETTGGNHTVNVQVQGTQVFTSNFVVLPSVSISPENGVVGTSISVSGKGFAATESSIQLIYDTSNLGNTVTAAANGSWSATVTAPTSYRGEHTIDASGATTLASNVANKTFTIKPAIVVNPLSCGVGCAVTVAGSGFANAETGINVMFDSTSIKTGLTADSSGAWSTTFNVPNTHSGSHTVDAYGSTTTVSEITDITFNIVSGISISKASANVGEVINVTGTGFGSNESNIYVTFDGVNQGGVTTADATGQWKVSLTIPAAVNGAHIIDAHGNITGAGSVQDKSLTILTKMVISPGQGNVGDTVTVTGTGFSGGKTVNVKFGAVSVISNINSDSTGGFAGTFKAPKGAGGEIKVVATDASNITASALFQMDKTAPPVPQIKSPAKEAIVGFIDKTKVDFKWNTVTDPSGVSYEIQVADDIDFKSIVFQHSGLTTAEYKSMDDEALPYGQYYWRVKAVDDATNASDWSAKIQFKSAFMPLTTLIIILAVIAVILIGLRVRAVFFKR